MKKQGIIEVFFFFFLLGEAYNASSKGTVFATYGPDWRVTYQQMGADIFTCAVEARAEQEGIHAALQVIYRKQTAPPYAMIYDPGHVLQPGSHVTFYVGDQFFVVYPPLEQNVRQISLLEQDVIQSILDGLHVVDHLVVSTVNQTGTEIKHYFSADEFLQALAGLNRICAIRAPLLRQKDQSAFKRKIEAFSKKRAPRKKQAAKFQVNTQRILDHVYIDLGQTGWAKKKDPAPQTQSQGTQTSTTETQTQETQT